MKEYEIDPEGEVKTLEDAVRRDMAKAAEKKKRLVEDSFQNVLKLEEMTPKGGSLGTNVRLDFLMEKLEETGEPDRDQKVQKLKKIKKNDLV